MIGNDIIDLALAKKQSNWQRRGFLDKIFTAKEQRWLAASNDTESAVWILWSMKESAYKIMNRETGMRSLNPSRFECVINYDGVLPHDGNVIFDDKLLFTRTIVTSQKIDTIAAADYNDLARIAELPADQVVFKADGLPFIIINETMHPISVSHHGRFIKKVWIN